jgi:hypothetical protein
LSPLYQLLSLVLPRTIVGTLGTIKVLLPSYPVNKCTITIEYGPSWSWSYGSWIYNYMCNQCLSPIQLWVWTLFMARCTRCNIMWQILSVTCDRSVVFFGYSVVSSTNKTNRHDITEILLKVALNTITPSQY